MKLTEEVLEVLNELTPHANDYVADRAAELVAAGRRKGGTAAGFEARLFVANADARREYTRQ